MLCLSFKTRPCVYLLKHMLTLRLPFKTQCCDYLLKYNVVFICVNHNAHSALLCWLTVNMCRIVCRLFLTFEPTDNFWLDQHRSKLNNFVKRSGGRAGGARIEYVDEPSKVTFDQTPISISFLSNSLCFSTRAVQVGDKIELTS